MEVPVLVLRPGPAPGSGLDADAALDVLWQCDPLAVWERADGSLLASFADATALADAHDALAARVAVTIEHHDDGLDAWREHATVSRVAETVVIRPPWVPYDAAAGEMVIDIDPGRAFGSGAHATTALCARRLVELVRPDDRVLDVGCGSGVLAVLAARLGARVDACDVDPAAVEATAENARANAVALAVRLGTLDGSGPEGGYDLIVANLLAPVLVTLAEPLRAVLAPGGVLVVSGLLDRRWSHVASALEPLVLVQVDHHEGWTALTLRTRREEPLPAR